MKKSLRILAIGDVIGQPGRTFLQKHLKQIKDKHSIDFVLVNGENSCNGRGITNKIVEFFKEHGVDVITSGNHIWANKEIYQYLDSNNDLLRPENYSSACPGSGHALFNVEGNTIAIVNLQGRVFMRDTIDCPFNIADSLLTYLKTKTKTIIIDFHAEATSEKLGLAYHLDGRVSAVLGTHTHVQTSDDRILPGGTAYISDLGMVGSLNSMIGMTKGPIIQHFLTQLPTRFQVDKEPPFVLSGVWLEVDVETGKAQKIEKIYITGE